MLAHILRFSWKKILLALILFSFGWAFIIIALFLDNPTFYEFIGPIFTIEYPVWILIDNLYPTTINKNVDFIVENLFKLGYFYFLSCILIYCYESFKNKKKRT
jgi:hypothetical protein